MNSMEKIELNEPFIMGLNQDIKRLLSYGTEQDRLNYKLNNAEVAWGGYNGTCAYCFKKLNNEQAVMISDAIDMAGNTYKQFSCLDCAGDRLNDFRKRFVK